MPFTYWLPNKNGVVQKYAVNSSDPGPIAAPHPLPSHTEVIYRQIVFEALRSNEIIPGLFISKTGILIGISNLNLRPGEENTVSIKANDLLLNPVSLESITEIVYDMPSMPQMGGPFKAGVTKKSPSEIETTLDIYHGGYWELIVKPFDSESEWIRVGIEIPKGSAVQ